jgi:hypothetical protein
MSLSQGIKFVILGLLLLPLVVSEAMSSPLHLTGNWSQPYGDDSDQWKLGQSYNLDLSNDLTSALRISGNVRYTTNKKKDAADTETLSPSLLIGLNNDLFSLSLNGMENRRKVEDEPTTINRSWSTTFITSLDDRYWPQLRLNYNQNFTTDDASPRSTDQQSNMFDSSLKYSWRFLSFLYDFSNSIDTNHIDKTENESNNHSARVQFQDTYWDNCLSIIASHKYTHNSNTISTTSGSSQISRPLLPTAGIASLDDTPLTDPLSPESTLIDNDSFTPTSIELVQPTETVNVGVQINLEDFNEIIFSLDREINSDVQSRLTWSFYGSLNNDDWQLLTIPATVVYSVEDGRSLVTIQFASTVSNLRYVKAVITSTAGIGTAYITEIDVNQLVTLNAGDSSLTTVSRTHLSQGSISYRPWDQWSIGYTFNRNDTSSDSGSTSVQLSQILNSALTVNRYFALSMSINESTDDIENQDVVKNRSYSLSYRATPLDSLSFSLGGTRSEYREDNTVVNRSDTFNSHLAATIYPDLTAGFSTNWTRNTDEETGIETTNWDYRVDIAARFTDTFNLSASYTFRDNDDGSTENNYELNTVYRPSSYISLTSGYKHTKSIDNIYSTLNFRLTQKIQTDFRYAYLEADTTVQSASFNLTWNLSTIFNIRQSLAWSLDDTEESWSGLTTVNYNF